MDKLIDITTQTLIYKLTNPAIASVNPSTPFSTRPTPADPTQMIYQTDSNPFTPFAFSASVVMRNPCLKLSCGLCTL